VGARLRIYLAGGLIVVLAAGTIFVTTLSREVATVAPPSSGPPPPTPESAESLLARADDLFRDGQWDAAVLAYDAASRAEPDAAVAPTRASTALVFAHRYPDAVDYAQVALALAPRSSAAHAALALAANWNRDPERARAEARRAVELDSANAVAHAYLAEVAIDQFRLAEAETELRRAQALAPDDPEVLRVSGYLLEAQQDYAAAVEQYELAIEQRPRWAHLRVSLGHALRVLRRYDEAIASFVEGADLAPGDPRPEGGLGMVYFDQEDYPTAADHYQRAIEIDPTYPTGYGQLGNIYYQRRDYAHAQPLFERAIELERDPTRNASYRHALGWIYLFNRQNADAREQFTRALELSPGLQGARDGLARLSSR
jgi:tetratricopeptide (TPR) repeat protein